MRWWRRLCGSWSFRLALMRRGEARVEEMWQAEVQRQRVERREILAALLADEEQRRLGGGR